VYYWYNWLAVIILAVIIYHKLVISIYCGSTITLYIWCSAYMSVAGFIYWYSVYTSACIHSAGFILGLGWRFECFEDSKFKQSLIYKTTLKLCNVPTTYERKPLFIPTAYSSCMVSFHAPHPFLINIVQLAVAYTVVETFEHLWKCPFRHHLLCMAVVYWVPICNRLIACYTFF